MEIDNQNTPKPQINKFTQNKDLNFVDIKVGKQVETPCKLYFFLKNIGVSETYISKLRKNLGYLKVNGKDVFINYQIKDGDLISFAVDPCVEELHTTRGVSSCIVLPNIVYNDNFLLIVNKPSGLPTLTSRSHPNDSLANQIMNYYKETPHTLRILNRLDKDTSGLVIVAKNLFTCDFITNIKKEYFAICEGNIPHKKTIEGNIKTLKTPEGINEQKRVIDTTDNSIKTIVEPIKKLGVNTLIKLVLQGGKTHQIRVHLSSQGNPLLGDLLYGKKSNLISHTALVCKSIEFNHPLNNKKIRLEIDFPNDFSGLLN